MGIESFPEIESFNKLPRQVLVKGANSTYDSKKGAQIHGIVINNSGHTIANLRVNLVVFDSNKIPVFNMSATPENEILTQGGVSSFSFQIQDHPEEIKDYHLFTSWKFYDRE